MKLLGVTGGVGMGKSTVGALLLARGVPVIDTDQLARQLVEPGQPALSEIAGFFGPQVLSPDGRLNRKALASQVFGDAEKRAHLEAILHPRIRSAWMDEARRWQESGRAVGAVIIPLLYETKAETSFDYVVCVACLAASQVERLRQRGWSSAETEQRLQALWPVEEKMTRADFVVWTDTRPDAVAAQLDKILMTIGAEPISSTASGAPA
jgi:dephospho-CoA kinase